MTIYQSRSNDDRSTISANHESNRNRLWEIQSEDSDAETQVTGVSKQQSPLHKLVGFTQPSSLDIRDEVDTTSIGDYDDEVFEYESLTYFNLPRPCDGEIIIAVQAATISSLKASVQKEVTIDNVSLDIDSGIAIVGVVREIGVNVDKSKVKVGDRVATILKTIMKNARYAQVSANMIVNVPFGLDSAEAAAAAYTYLLGFQSLTHGIINPRVRYSSNLFSMKNILITNGTSTAGQALIQMSKSLGSDNVYATGPRSHHDLLKSIGAYPLSEEPAEWLGIVEGQMHVVVDTVHAKNFQCHALERALVKEGGKIVFVGCPIHDDGLKYGRVDSWMCLIRQILAQSALCVSSADASYYDLFSNLDNYPEKLKVSALSTRSMNHNALTLVRIKFVMIETHQLFSPSERLAICTFKTS